MTSNLTVENDQITAKNANMKGNKKDSEMHQN